MAISRSPDRGVFQINSFIRSMGERGKTVDNDTETAAMVEVLKRENKLQAEMEMDPEWQKNNMEYDLRSTPWILEKVRGNTPDYPQKLYAAMCNNEFMRLDLISILKEEIWGCSWRHAGGIIADMLGEGDYIDWYCSGGEGHIADEVREDLKRLGWVPVPGGDWDLDNI